MKQSVNVYTSICCNAEATKPPCVKPRPVSKPKGKRGKNRGEDKPKAPEFATLGSWRCTDCGKPCKVSVSPRPPQDLHKEVAEKVVNGDYGRGVEVGFEYWGARGNVVTFKEDTNDGN